MAGAKRDQTEDQILKQRAYDEALERGLAIKYALRREVRSGETPLSNGEGFLSELLRERFEGAILNWPMHVVNQKNMILSARLDERSGHEKFTVLIDGEIFENVDRFGAQGFARRMIDDCKANPQKEQSSVLPKIEDLAVSDGSVSSRSWVTLTEEQVRDRQETKGEISRVRGYL